MNKNTKHVVLAGTVAICVLGVVYGWLDYSRSRQGPRDCGPPDGIHYPIDTREFATKYTGYTLTLEGEIKDKGKIGGTLGETQYQQLSDSLQQANAFRKALVAGFNSCAVSRKAYETAILHFEDIDKVAREVEQFLKKDQLDASQTTLLGQLIGRYSDLTSSTKLN